MNRISMPPKKIRIKIYENQDVFIKKFVILAARIV
jgi:hypothetical protein